MSPPCVVPDSSPLITLAKLERVDLLASLYGQVLVSPAVWHEAVTMGRAIGALDAGFLEGLERKGAIRRVALKAKERTTSQGLHAAGRLGSGESEVLAIARERKGLAVMDDKSARVAAVALGVSHVGTLGVLYESFTRRMLSYAELESALDSVARESWVSPRLVTGILRRARERQP